jgi:hypothetical protein
MHVIIKQRRNRRKEAIDAAVWRTASHLAIAIRNHEAFAICPSISPFCDRIRYFCETVSPNLRHKALKKIATNSESRRHDSAIPIAIIAIFEAPSRAARVSEIPVT